MWEYNYTCELYHHGIKGMRWGVRRFQNSNGSLTNAGKKRYDDTSDNTKSKHRTNLESSYRKLGMSKQEAEVAANKRIRTEKAIAAAAGLTLTACAAYAINAKVKDRLDSVIKSDDILQRIEMQDTNGKLHDMFYAAKGEHDTARYKNILGNTRQHQTGKAYIMQLQANKDIKVASKDNAAKIFGDLYKNDSDFRKAVEQNVSNHFGGSNVVKNVNNMSNKNIKKMYENFNAGLIDIRQKGSGADKKFYSKLKDAGYGAVQDINDMKYSGYKAKNPLIIFDNANKNVMVKSYSQIKENLEQKAQQEALKARWETTADQFMRKTAPTIGIGLSGLAVKKYRTEPIEEQKYY